jgi:hypothetical protein
VAKEPVASFDRDVLRTNAGGLAPAPAGIPDSNGFVPTIEQLS